MTTTTREGRLVDAFATLADTLVDDYDVIDLLQTLVDDCHDILDVKAAGILLVEGRGRLEVVASTSEEANLVEIMQVDAQQGPCFDCFSTGRVVSLPDVDDEDSPDAARWARFRRVARDQGFGSVYAIPLRLRDEVIGTLNLLRSERTELNRRDIRAAQALADVATIGIVHQRTFQESELVRRQLQGALETRVVIEQAKGVVSHTRGVTTDEAFELIRGYARKNRLLLTDVARQLVELRLAL